MLETFNIEVLSLLVYTNIHHMQVYLPNIDCDKDTALTMSRDDVTW